MTWKPVSTQPPLPLPPINNDVSGLTTWSSGLSRQLYSYLADIARSTNAAIKTDEPLTDAQLATLATLYGATDAQLTTLTTLWGLTEAQAAGIKTSLTGVRAWANPLITNGAVGDDGTQHNINIGWSGAYIIASVDNTGIPGALAPYYEGTWTPTIGFQSNGDLTATYTEQIGKFIQIGKLVYLAWSVIFTPTYTTAGGLFELAMPNGWTNPMATSQGVGQTTNLSGMTGFISPCLVTFIGNTAFPSMIFTTTADGSQIYQNNVPSGTQITCRGSWSGIVN